ncbi:hypothetical protein F4809DRAFT_645980 [Biscogniauxia mediterranea]|nr:hypothetical protein F4809DRAFT_645980 [Biscogniauxia mediterranea]
MTLFVPNSSTHSPGPNLGISGSVCVYGEYFQGCLNVQIEQTFATRFLDLAPEFAGVPSLDDLPLCRFLRPLDTTPPAANGGVDLLTPFIYQPYPSTFWTDRVGHESSSILLYGQNNGDSPVDGGIYVDIRSYQAIWHSGNAPRFPPSDQWLPLEVFLLKALDAWATGKFYWDAQEATIKVRSWTQHDVEANYYFRSSYLQSLSTPESRISYLHC